MSIKLVAWDTSSKAGAIAALEAKDPGEFPKLVAEFTLNVDLTHSERLLWGIHQVLESARWSPAEVDRWGVGLGPGSFTGLRVGLTTARTLAHTLKKPLVGVSSLAALARPVALGCAQEDDPVRTWVIATRDACKGELFSLTGLATDLRSYLGSPDQLKGGFALQSEGSSSEQKILERVVSPSVLVDDLNQTFSEKDRWIAVGEGRERYLEEWNRLPKENEILPSFPYANQIQGRMIALLAWEAFEQGMGTHPLQVFPRYLRASAAEVNLKAGLLGKAR